MERISRISIVRSCWVGIERGEKLLIFYWIIFDATVANASVIIGCIAFCCVILKWSKYILIFGILLYFFGIVIHIWFVGVIDVEGVGFLLDDWLVFGTSGLVVEHRLFVLGDGLID